MLNKKIPCSIAFFTSTQGHFKVRDRYLQTLQNLDKQIPLSEFESLVAHIKFSPNKEEEEYGIEMSKVLQNYGFKVLYATADWSHGQGKNHGEEYLKDIFSVYSTDEILNSKYVLHQEDDMPLICYEKDLTYWFYTAIEVLNECPEFVQARFARFVNEEERIQSLKAKHGIDGQAMVVNDNISAINDFSLNPCIFRPRDVKAALVLMQKNPQIFEAHPEHGLSKALKYLFPAYRPFFVLNPRKIKARHIGTPLGQEDPIEPLKAN